MKVLSRLFLVLAGMVVVLGVLAAPVSGAMGPPLGGVDIADSNIRMLVTGTKEECSAACDAEPACAAATFVLPGTIQGPDGHCWLKSASTPQTDNFNCYSFVKLAVLPVFGCVMSNPKADFTMLAMGNQQPRGFAPLVVQFTDLSTGATGGRTWDFGDGSALSHEQNPVHTYTAGSPGGTYYDVALTVLGACPGESSVKKREKEVRIFDNIGFLGITSTPPGATVFIDGALVAGTTSETPGEPLHLSPGSHTVRLTLEGYREVSDSIVVENGKTIMLALLLEKSAAGSAPSPPTSPPATGSLLVTTLPGGATVAVDGAPRGTAPVTVTGLAAGSHTVTLSKAGYTDYTGTLTLPAGKTTMLNITLVTAPASAGTAAPSLQGPRATASAAATQAAAGTPPPAGTGSLTIRSDPAGANVYLDGEKAGTTPATLRDIPAGTHRLLLTLQGYPDISRTVEIAAGPNPEVSVTFTGKKTPGFVLPVALGALISALLVMQGRRKSR